MAHMRAWVYLLFFFSGLTGLLYEIVWIRSAGTVLGNTTYAVGTVVGVYMAGMAFGAWLGGRAADRRGGSGLLRLYGLLEAGIAGTVLLVPVLLAAAAPLFRAGAGTGTSELVVRVLLLALVLAVPTTLMGATLPVLARYFAESGAGAAGAAGRAYAWNTLGGVVGTLAAGFWLLPSLGLRTTTLAAVAVNAGIAGAALLLARRGAAAPPTAPEPRAPLPPRVLAVAALSGLAALAYEVAWTRLIVLSVGSTVYSFTLVLAVFIFGLAAGSALGSRWVGRAAHPERVFAGLQIGIGVLALVGLNPLGELPLSFAHVMNALRRNYDLLLLAQAGLTAVFLLPPTLLMGAVFPFACRMALAGDVQVGRSVAGVYTWNTLGSIAGTLAATFLVLPSWGPGVAVKMAVAVNMAVAALLLWTSGPSSRLVVALPAVAVLSLFLLPGLSPEILSSGAYLYGKRIVDASVLEGKDVREHLEDQALLESAWDAYGLVTVHRIGLAGDLALRINGKVDASTGSADMATQQFLAHLPLLHHAAPKRVMVVGLGAGITVGAAAAHGAERVDCVEISPAVARAARHFRAFNGNCLENPKVRLRIGDGRQFLQATSERYDAIICEPSNLWLSGMANLFTREFFEEASTRLAPGGFFCQWIHGYRLSGDDFRAVLRTFFSVFRGGGVWELDPAGDYLLLGNVDGARVAWGDYVERSKSAGEQARELVDPFQPPGVALAGALVADAASVRTALGNSGLLTDDHCSLEYSAPRYLYRMDRSEILGWLDRLRGSGAVEQVYVGLAGETKAQIERRRAGRREVARAMLPFMEGPPAEAGPSRVDTRSIRSLQLLDGVLAKHGTDLTSRRLLDDRAKEVLQEGKAALAARHPDVAAEYFEAMPKGVGPFVEAKLALGRIRLQAGDAARGKDAFLEAHREVPRSLAPVLGWAVCAVALGRDAEALEAWSLATVLAPRRPEAWVGRADLLRKLGRTSEAKEACGRALQVNPGYEPAVRLLQALGN